MEKELCPLMRFEAAEVKLKDHQLWVNTAQGRPLLHVHEYFGLTDSVRSVGLLKTNLCCTWKSNFTPSCAMRVCSSEIRKFSCPACALLHLWLMQSSCNPAILVVPQCSSGRVVCGCEVAGHLFKYLVRKAVPVGYVIQKLHALCNT